MDTNPVTPAKPRRGIYLLPNLLTTGAMFSGFYAIIASIGGDYVSAVIAIFVAGLFDGLDGRVARLTNTQSEFGVQYDSLSDLVSFGVAPALVLFTWSLSSLAVYGPAWGKVGWAAAFIYAACGALRLARFNTQVGVQDKRYFQGLAIPAGAALVMSFVWMTLYLGHTGADVQFITPFVAAVTGLLMVSRFRYYSFKVWPKGDKVTFIWIPVALLIVVAVVINPPCVLFGIAAAYALSGPILTPVAAPFAAPPRYQGDVNAARPLPHDSPERRALAFLAELSQALTQSLDLNRTLRLSVTRIARFMKAEAVSLFLIDAKTGLLVCRHCAGPVDITGLKLTVGQGVVGRAVSDNATQIVRDAQNDPRVHQSVDAETGFITKSILCAPLRTAQGVIGALEIINRRDGGLFDEDDADILRLIAAPAALAIHSAQLTEGLIEQQRIKRELTLARQMQKSLLPKTRRDAFPIVGVNLPANEISGDFYDYFPLPDGRIGFVIADVSGKGLDAAFLMVRVTSMLRSTGRQAPKPSEWLSNVNAELCGTLQDGRFVCAAVGIYDRATGDVALASAGFPPALLYDGESFEEIEADGPPLGILPEAEYGEHHLHLGSRAMYLFSDGATDVHKDEAHASDGERLGAHGLRDLIVRYSVLSPEPRLRALLGDLKRLTLVDDTTILLVQEPRGTSAIKLLDLTFPAEAAQMRTVRAALREALDSQEIGPELRDRLVLAVDEACTNIMRHAYGGQCSETISLHLSREKDMLLFELRDQAPIVDARKLKPRDLSECRPGGLGLPFIDALMDEWKLQPAGKRKGNVLRMMKRLTLRDRSSGDA